MRFSLLNGSICMDFFFSSAIPFHGRLGLLLSVEILNGRTEDILFSVDPFYL